MRLTSLLLAIVAVAGCTNANAPKPTAAASAQKASVRKATFGKTADGQAVDAYTLTNANGVEVTAITFGGIITSIRIPDRNGKFDNVALGFGTLEPYIRNPPYFGAIIGRYGNRIAKGRFSLDGKTYTLATNNGPN